MTSKKPSKARYECRRSGRVRKPTYDTLNQTLLFGQYQADLFYNGNPSESNRPSNRRSFEPQTNGSGRILRKSDGNSREVLALHDHHRSAESDEEETFDIYSRVKRRRRTNSHGHILYGVESHEDSNQSVIDAHSNPASNNSTPKKTDRVESSSDDDSNEEQLQRRYFLRQQKAAPQRFEIVLPEPRKKSNDVVEKSEYERSAFRSPAHKRVKRDLLRRAHVRKLEHVSSTSSSDDDDNEPDTVAERSFEMRKAKSLDRSRSRFLPINISPKAARSGIYKERIRAGASCADLEPMLMDQTVSFDQIGGLNKHVHSLKEMILFPFLYPEVFEKFKITPPRGVLFYGPPGTGKTLVARALANECSKNGRKISFFMRKGADCLSKWVGESERQLRLLFDQAFTMRPSIIFFDEIDGLAPVRSSRQDQIHSSIVSTLLALMDGLDQRGDVVVIGATNRLDALDPALRRPGRFDRELRFNLPDLNARKKIFQIHTSDWKPPLNDKLVEQLAAKSVGYCGADIKGLCTEATLIALRKRYPQIYSSEQKLQLDANSIQVDFDDFLIGMRRVVPAMHRSIGPPTRPLASYLVPILDSSFSLIMSKISSTFRCSTSNGVESTNDSLFNELEKQQLSFTQKILISGDGAEHAQTNHLAPAVFHALDHLPVFSLAVPQIFSASYRTPEEAVAEVLSTAAKSGPCVVYLPSVDSWRNVVSPSAWYTLTSIVESWHSNVCVLLLATAHQSHRDLELEVKTLFTAENVHECTPPSAEMRRKFFTSLLIEDTMKLPNVKPKRNDEILDVAPVAKPQPLSHRELKSYHKKEKQVLRQLRIFLREIVNRLIRDRRFAIFSKPVDPIDVPDYKEIVSKPMDLSTMMAKIDSHQYESVEDFLSDIDLITQNALEYNPNRDQTDKFIRHRACALRDVANALIDDELDSDFETQCVEMKEFRRTRGVEGPVEPPPAFINLTKCDHLIVPDGSELDGNKRQNDTGSIDTHNNSMRRRRNSDIWCRPKRKRIATTNGAKAAAIVQKYRNVQKYGSVARRQLNLKNNADPKPSSIEDQSDEEGDKSDVEKSYSSTKDQVDSEENPLSDLLSRSNLDIEDEEEQDETVPPELPIIVCDKAKLARLVDYIVGRTTAWSVARLETLYASMVRVIERYADKFDRSSMIDDLDNIIRSATK